MPLFKRLRAALPTRDHLLRYRLVAVLEPYLHHPGLWHLSRRSFALGAALGVFFGLLIPVGQIPFAVLAAIGLRANVGVAAASTFITNPFTFGPIYYAAYYLGRWVMGVLGPAVRAPGTLRMVENAVEAGGDQPLWHRVFEVWPPLQLGLAIAATVCSLLVYWGIQMLWRWYTRRRWRTRSARAAAGRP